MNQVVELRQPIGGLTTSQSNARMAVADIIQHVATVQEIMRAVMKVDVHYGTIPGTPKPTLYKAGAEVLSMVFRIADTYQIDDLSTEDVVRYRVTCIGTHQGSGVVLGSGLGEASSAEEKYKWRKAICKEEFDATPINLRRTKFARGKGGTHYTQEQIRTETADLANTILKMANKRAKMAMVLNVTAASDCFSQDLEDMDDALRDHLTRHEGDAGTGKIVQEAVLPPCSQEHFDKNLPAWLSAIAVGKATADQIIAKASTKYTLTDAQREAIRAKPVVSDFEQLKDRIQKAADIDALYVAADLIGELPLPEHRAELSALFEDRKTQIEGA